MLSRDFTEVNWSRKEGEINGAVTLTRWHFWLCPGLLSHSPFLYRVGDCMRVIMQARLRVRTHQQGRVESNSVQSGSQRRCSDSLAYFQWPLRQCVHTAESSRIQFSHTSLAEPRVLSRMFYFRQSDSSDRT